MKKAGLLICYCLLFFFATAQLPTIVGNHQLIEKIHGIDTVSIILFDKIDSNTSIEFAGTDVKWYKFDNLSTPVSTLNYMYGPEDATGYRVDVDGKFKNIWIINYQNYLTSFTELYVDQTTESQCSEINLKLTGVIPELKYYTSLNVSHTLPREFKVEYKTMSWTTRWNTVDTVMTITLPNENIVIPAPLCKTTFKISGDKYATEFGLTPASITSSDYSAVAVKCHPTSITSERIATNEEERPSKTTINGSAPLEIQFLSNANEPVAQFYKWEIFKNRQLIISRNDKDHRYTFTEFGDYSVKVTASNSSCSYSDSINVVVSESQIQVPNVFTPNGDDQNDEFRIAYKSIVSFECWVYNRWGRLVYHWNDPTKGWDGTINGRKASAGAYYYIIEAYGSDYNPKSGKISGSKFRVGEYVLKGDINLLRGKE